MTTRTHITKKTTHTLARRLTAEQWADRIRTQLGQSVEAILEVGRLLQQAKAALVHGEWGRMFSEGLLPLSPRSAQRLMAIADHAVLSNTTHGSHLPPSWRTLYELTKLPVPVLKNALKDGVITPDMPRKAVAALGRAPRREEATDGLVTLEPISRSSEDALWRRVRVAIRPVIKLMLEWPDDHSYGFIIHALEQQLKYARRFEDKFNIASLDPERPVSDDHQ
jgi:hypothetical protein